MGEIKKENTQIESPTNHVDLEVSEMKSTAGGLTAIKQSLEYAYGEMGLPSRPITTMAKRFFRASLKINVGAGLVPAR